MRLFSICVVTKRSPNSLDKFYALLDSFPPASPQKFLFFHGPKCIQSKRESTWYRKQYYLGEELEMHVESGNRGRRHYISCSLLQANYRSSFIHTSHIVTVSQSCQHNSVISCMSLVITLIVVLLGEQPLPYGNADQFRFCVQSSALVYEVSLLPSIHTHIKYVHTWVSM